MLGPLPHELLYPLYQRADLVVCPSYAESFGHPMVEAMASGKPIVASDRPEHREVCGAAALYFGVFDPTDLAERIEAVLVDRALSERLADHGRQRARDFSWDKHFAALLETVEATLQGKEERCRPIRNIA
jgi:glycosyltransferase involved in cell wall biosynthesis